MIRPCTTANGILLFITLYLAAFSAIAQVSNPASPAQAYWYDGNIKQPLWSANNEISIIRNKNSLTDERDLLDSLENLVPSIRIRSAPGDEIIRLVIPPQISR